MRHRSGRQQVGKVKGGKRDFLQGLHGAVTEQIQKKNSLSDKKDRVWSRSNTKFILGSRSLLFHWSMARLIMVRRPQGGEVGLNHLLVVCPEHDVAHGQLVAVESSYKDGYILAVSSIWICTVAKSPMVSSLPCAIKVGYLEKKRWRTTLSSRSRMVKEALVFGRILTTGRRGHLPW